MTKLKSQLKPEIKPEIEPEIKKELDLKQNYRQTIGLFATGVTVLIIESEGEVHCMTANAVSSLSLEPLQLLVCPSKTAIFSKYVKEGASFTVNILGEHQEDISNHFAKASNKTETSDPFYDYLFSNKISSPRLNDCIASFACKISQIHDGGDHWIVVGEVQELYRNKQELQPLLFYGGKYHYPCAHQMELIEPSADPYK
jgi:flavin reductase (DIM6/NTAB) family NADH-FMN oxidoreductase RutF